MMQGDGDLSLGFGANVVEHSRSTTSQLLQVGCTLRFVGILVFKKLLVKAKHL
jgi:hypothetical protein